MTDELIRQLGEDLGSCGYTTDTLTALWGPEAEAALHRGFQVPALSVLSAREHDRGRLEPAATLARLFIFGCELPREAVEAAFPTLGVAGAEALGLIDVVAPGSIRARLDLRPYAFSDAGGEAHWWIASDFGEMVLGRSLDVDHVLGIGGASTSLLNIAITDERDAVLDLGTGCGIQAMHASRHARRVVGTDISARALDIARFNAALNGIDSIDFRLGSLFEPVTGERFGQVLSNPPFVITPREPGVPTYEYRDGGKIGDQIVADVIRGLDVALEPGGIGQLLGNWEYHDEASGFERIEQWLQGTSLDAWVIERELQDPHDYAETWIRDGGTRPGSSEFDSMYRAWLEDFRARGVRSVGFGYVLLRRTAGAPTLRRFEQLHTPLPNPGSWLGGYFAETLRRHDWLAARDDDALALARLAVADDVTEERHYRPGAEDPGVIMLRQGSGFGRTRPLDTALAGLVGACDGELPLGAICYALAELLGVDEAELRAQTLPAVRQLVLDGFLTADVSAD
ncbi:methyltransferase [Saxibacter everestensis]|uniref:Methyltransferase n=1 Tax=Saxibacter everestensis TaxID=2909229 RepID=A0ABY8QQ34_9MICO|nr:methyltransferase [Brevibacteriaceae bacterium ZFBP1038]